jgi:malonyl-ACP decarboxylase
MRLDGHRFSDPNLDGEVAVMRQAIAAAGLTTGDIDYVNAHGTASPLGDDTEMAAIAHVFEGRLSDWRADPLFVNSTKSILGHTLSAAGILESIAVLIQLDEGWLHPTLGLSVPIAPCPPLVAERHQPPRLRHALSNSFGFSGINTSVLWSKE